MSVFSALDWAIIAIYLFGVLALGVFLSRRVTSDTNYYLGDRTLPWWAIGISVVATYVGALTFLGGPAWSYADGLSVILIHINYPIAIFIVISVFLPFFYNTGIASIFDYLERRFGVRARSLMSAIFLFGNFAYSGIMLYTTALVLSYVSDLEIVPSILLVATVATTYTLLGGMSAVIWTDVVQTTILIIGAVLILVLIVAQLPDGLIGSLSELKREGYSEAFKFSTDPSIVSTVWTGIVAMSVYHVTVYGANQMMIQRALSARSIGDAKKSYILMGYCAFFLFFTFFIIGLLLRILFEGQLVVDENLLLLEFVATLSIPGLLGFVAVAATAAAMSSLDSSLNSMATVTTIDFYQRFIRKEAPPKHYLLVSRIITLGWSILIVIPALLFIGSTGSVLELLSKIGSYFVGAKLAAFVLGFYSKHTTENGLLIGIGAGFAAILGLDIFADVAWPWYCLVGGIVSIICSWIASVAMNGFSTDYHPYSVRGEQARFRRENLPEKEGGWYVAPGKIDRASYGLIAFFVATLVFLWLFQSFIP